MKELKKEELKAINGGLVTIYDMLVARGVDVPDNAAEKLDTKIFNGPIGR